MHSLVQAVLTISPLRSASLGRELLVPPKQKKGGYQVKQVSAKFEQDDLLSDAVEKPRLSKTKNDMIIGAPRLQEAGVNIKVRMLCSLNCLRLSGRQGKSVKSNEIRLDATDLWFTN